MALTSCRRCKKLFLKVRGDLCVTCETHEEQEYDRVREHIARHPQQTAEEISKALDIEIDTVLRFIKDGRIEVMGASRVICGRCGKPAISASKKLCTNCLGKLNTELARQQASMSGASKSQKTEPSVRLNTYSERK